MGAGVGDAVADGGDATADVPRATGGEILPVRGGGGVTAGGILGTAGVGDVMTDTAPLVLGTPFTPVALPETTGEAGTTTAGGGDAVWARATPKSGVKHKKNANTSRWKERKGMNWGAGKKDAEAGAMFRTGKSFDNGRGAKVRGLPLTRRALGPELRAE